MRRPGGSSRRGHSSAMAEEGRGTWPDAAMPELRGLLLDGPLGQGHRKRHSGGGLSACGLGEIRLYCGRKTGGSQLWSDRAFIEPP